jgi:glycosyltransferase involved in cell wall biosynthesis
VAILVARLVEQKRADRFLRALQLARRVVPELRGLIVGDGPARSELEAVHHQLGEDREHVQFLGTRDDVPTLLRNSDMLVATSDHEGCPNVILEAMAAGLPVITTPAGDAGRIVQDDVTGYVVAMSDVHGLAERMVSLALSPDLRAQLGSAGRNRVQSQYGFEGHATRILGIYRKIAQQQRNNRVLNTLMNV